MTPGRLIFLIIGLAAIVAMAGALFDHAPTDSGDEADVIFLMGQSNAGYRIQTAVASEADPIPEEGMAFYYGTTTRPAMIDADASSQSIIPMVSDGAAVIGDKWPSIASRYTSLTGHKVVLAQLSKVNEKIESFDPDDGYMWELSVTRVGDVLTAMEDYGLAVGKCFVVWIQGESNRIMTGDEYAERLLTIGTTIINGGLGADVSPPILISKTRGTGGSVEGQELLVSEKPGMFRFASTVATTFSVEAGTMADDDLHYSQAGNNILGAEIGEAVAAVSNSEFKMDKAIWGIIAIGIGAIVLFGAISAVTRN